MHPTLDSRQTWTFADLQALPENVDWRRYEIVDGALVVSPSAAPVHEYVSGELRFVLRSVLPADLMAIGPVALDLSPSYRIPDLVVLPKRVLAALAQLVRPVDTLLAVEIVSPGSVTTDRVTKPAQYAAAGIPSYWRVETAPEVSLTAYELAGDIYRELGTWGLGEVAVLERPFPIRVTIADLMPPVA